MTAHGSTLVKVPLAIGEKGSGTHIWRMDCHGASVVKWKLHAFSLFSTSINLRGLLSRNVWKPEGRKDP